MTLDDDGVCSDAELQATLAEILVGTNGAGISREASSATPVPEVQDLREGLVTQNDPNPFVS